MQLNVPTEGTIASCLVEIAAALPRIQASQGAESKANEQAMEDMLIGPFKGMLDSIKGAFNELGDMASDVRSFFNQDFNGMMEQLTGMYMDDPTRLGGFMMNIDNLFAQFKELGTANANEILQAIDALKKAFMLNNPQSILGIIIYAVTNGFTSIFLHEQLLSQIQLLAADMEREIKQGGIPDEIDPKNPFKETMEHLCLAKGSLTRVINDLSDNKFNKPQCGAASKHLGNAVGTLKTGKNSLKFIGDTISDGGAQVEDSFISSVNKTWLPNYKLKLKQESMLYMMGPLGKTSNEIWKLHSNLSNAIAAFTVNIDLDQYFVLIFQFLINEIDRIEAMLRKALNDLEGEIKFLESQIEQKLALLGQVGSNVPLAAQNASIRTEIKLGFQIPATASAVEKMLEAKGIKIDTRLSDLDPRDRAEVNRVYQENRSNFISDASDAAISNSHVSSKERQLRLVEEIKELRRKQEEVKSRAKMMVGGGSEIKTIFQVLQTHVEAFIQISILQGMTKAVCLSYDKFNQFLNVLGTFNPNSILGKINKSLEKVDPSNCPEFYGNKLLCDMSKLYITMNKVYNKELPQSDAIKIARVVQADVAKQRQYIACLKEKLGVVKGDTLAILAAIGGSLQIIQLLSDGFSMDRLGSMLGLDFGGLFGSRDTSLYEAVLRSLICIIQTCDNPGIQKFCQELITDVQKDKEKEESRFMNPAHSAKEAEANNTFQGGGGRFSVSAAARLVGAIQNFKLCLPSQNDDKDQDTQGKSERNKRTVVDIFCKNKGEAHIPGPGDNKSMIQNDEQAKAAVDA